MKKLLYSIMALAGLTMASCTQEHIDVQYNPENVVAPVLGAIADVDFTKDEANIVVEYTNANFKVATSNSKDLYVDVKGNDFENKVKLNAEFNDKLTIKLTDLYAAVLSLGGKPGEDIDVDLMINAYLTTDKGTFIAGTESVSNTVSIKVKSAAFTAPVISDVADAVLKENAADIVIDYTEADFNIATEHKVTHSLYVDLAGKEFKGKTMVDAKFEEGKITVKAADLNKTLLNAGVEGGEAKDIDFAIIATVDAIAGASAMSNIDSANIKTYASNIIPAEKYAKMYVVGTLNSWDHATVAKEFDFLYNYNVENTSLYTGIIDLRKPDSAAEFKFTSGNWGKDEHSMTGENAAEASTVTLVAGGGDNINVWQTKRFYGAELDVAGLTLKKLWSADQIGIIGLNGDWEKDIVMEYNAKWDRFYADIEAAADTEMKFRADGGWDLNWGVDCANGGDNIKVTAGKYRVYFNPVSGLIEFNAKAFDTTEDTEATGGATPEEPEEPEGPVTEENRWGVVGTITEWGKQADLYMDEVAENIFVRTGVTLTADDEFKVRYNNNWDESYGAEGEVATVTVGEKFVLSKKDSKNLKVAAGTYDIYIDTKDFNLWVMNANETPAELNLVTYKLYADVSAAGWKTCKVYGWGDAGEFAGSWSGSEMTATKVDGKDYFVWQFNVVAKGKTIGFVLNNGEGGDNNQTENIDDLKLESDVYVTVLASEDGKAKCKYTLGK